MQFRPAGSALLLLLSVASSHRGSLERVLDRGLHHLRSGAYREWDEFSGTPEGRELTITFTAKEVAQEKTLRLRHRDVKQAWKLVLNGRDLGQLPQEENDMISCWRIEPGRLAAGENTLRIQAATDKTDDIIVGNVFLYDRPLSELAGDATVLVTVRDAQSKGPLPCRITVTDSNGSLVPLSVKTGGRLAAGKGMVYTGNGRAGFGLMAGRYVVYVTRGFEYGVSTADLAVSAGENTRLDFTLRREVVVDGYISCDTHTHTHSGHGDASIDDRVLSIAGEGIELAVSTDHNTLADYEPVARKNDVRRHFTPVLGSEITTQVGHFNVFPIPHGFRLPDHRLPDWPSLFAEIRRNLASAAVVLNHPRDIHAGFRPFDPEHHNVEAGESRKGWAFEADAMEVVNSGALQSNPMRLYQDWFALLNRGYRVTPVGSSDSHDVGRLLLGQGRTYIAGAARDPARIDVAAAVRNFREGRVLVSMGLLTEMTVNGGYFPGDLAPAGDGLRVSVIVRGPSWSTADRVALFMNGIQVRETKIASSGKSVRKWQGEWSLPAPKHDVHLVALALGPGVTAPFWRIPKPYQPTTPEWKSYVIGSTGAVWIDADADGKMTSAYEYAHRLVREFGGDPRALREKLGSYDRAVAALTAHLLKPVK